MSFRAKRGALGTRMIVKGKVTSVIYLTRTQASLLGLARNGAWGRGRIIRNNNDIFFIFNTRLILMVPLSEVLNHKAFLFLILKPFNQLI